jgi:ABC-type Mn2+/Zn2+ transport system ATPase subunit
LPALEVHDLSVAYNRIIALKPSSCSLPPAKMMAVAGPNGAGKSSFLKAILNIVKRQSGQVFVNGHSFNKPQLAATYNISYVPQRSLVDWFFPISVYGVVAMGLKKNKLFAPQNTKKITHQRILSAIEQVGMSQLAHRQIGELSGGQQQRVFFARALVSQPKLLLLDEPFNGIDAPTTDLLFQILSQHAKNNHTAVLCVHHNVNSLHKFDLVTLINQQIITSDTPKNALSPSNIKKTFGDQLKL